MSGSIFEKPLNHSSNHIIFKEKDNAAFLYILEKGKVLLTKKGADGLVPIRLIQAPAILDEGSVFDDAKYNVTAISVTDVTLQVIKKSAIMHVLSQCPNWIKKLLNTLSDRQEESQKLLADNRISDDEYMAIYSKLKPETRKKLDSL